MRNTSNNTGTPGDVTLLRFAMANGTIDMDALQKEYILKRKNTYINDHSSSHKIWRGKDGAYYTLLPDCTKKNNRRLLKRKTEEELHEAIFEHYAEIDGTPTFSTCFENWSQQKLDMNEICKGTFDRYHSEFKRFIGWNDIKDKKICDITEHELEIFVRTTIAKLNLTAKAFSNMRTLVIGAFKWAKKYGYTNISISSFFGDLDLSKKAFKKSNVRDKTQIFDEDEVPRILSYLREHPTIENLGILLTFQTGIREGELSGLKFSDVCKDKTLHIQRQEIKYKSPVTGKCTHEIVEYTKSDAGDRYIILTPAALETIQKIRILNPHNEYMMQVGKRKVWTNTFNDRLYKVCDALEIERRSMHKIRKTYGTALLDANVEDSLVMSQMGHSDITTTRKYYYYSRRNAEHKRQQIMNAIPF
ncbi:tyrosine-type recombinase/integrase [Butyrivibrio sp. JL13D10]|uniref:tyrosine-type recombinase/integrase n=1 Tax=Butyrivibrio sp. JL13D10 TaxID=3236815 RepID=UPI0038B432B9